jgi:uncharacterized protein (TIGR02996 family)
MNRDELMNAVCSAPDEDGPRLAFARELEQADPERCEFVRLQLARAKQDREQHLPQRRLSVSSREYQLLHRHKAEWSRYLRMILVPETRSAMDLGCDFERGFVNFARIADHELVSLGVRVFEWAPIQHIDVTPGSTPLSRILSNIGAGRLDSISLAGRNLTDDDAVALSQCEGIARATWIDLRDNQIGQRGVVALARSSVMKNKVRVMLNGNPCDPTDTPWFDHDGSITRLERKSSSQAIEDAAGQRLAWLHYPWPNRASEPDRFHTRWFVSSV